MAKPRARKLKVFQAQLGFFDSVVAAPSKAAALRAWGTHQDLFASGDARIATDKAAVAAAIEHPETPLARAIGTDDPFQLQPSGSSRGPRASKKEAGRSGKAEPPEARPDRSELDAAKSALARLDQTRRREEADLEREQEDLDVRRSAARETYAEARKTAAAALAAARAAYRAAGGTGSARK